MANNNELSEVKKRVEKLEKFREEDSEKINKNSSAVDVILEKLISMDKNITSLIQSVEKSISFNNEMQIKENKTLNEKIEELEKKYNNLEKIVDERTILKDNNNYNKIKIEIVLTIIGLIVGGIVGTIIKF